MAKLSSEQRTILAEILRQGQNSKDPKRYIRAAVQTGLVESNLRNLPGGDADSQGWRQERASIYGTGSNGARNIKASVRRFFKESAQHDRGQPSWQLAADVQRPAAQYRGRYKEVASQAERLVKGKYSSSGGGTTGGGSATASSTTPLTAKFDPGSAALTSLSSELSSSRQAPTVTAPTPPAHSAGPTTPAGYGELSSSGVSDEHSQVSDALSKLAELQPAQGGISTATSGGKTVSSTSSWGGKKGKVVEVGGGKVDLRPRGGWKGTNGPVADFSRLGQALGLSVTSSKRDNQNPYSGKNSDHEVTKRNATARDMSNGSSPTPQMDRYAKQVADALGIAYKKGTPVNKSKTVNGVRYQLIYRGTGAAFGGNHMNHVHLGAERVGR